ncbi:transketolase [Tepidanaerobacter sp. GT38]|uniref:transketolase n=1 Tax=Tepidanaerobacter sp. GT38 TaxID=2722793 RepID=UPI001F1D758D|nr:transketolase [Tepidanaerobacter sp. GT38]MCG1013095.1 transketolase [Tepidanaerobacter sp. GT38]
MSVSRQTIEELQSKARIIRRHIVEMIAEAGSGHPGGSLSSADIVTALYFHVMNVDPKNPKWPERDRLVLSKGHAAPVVYAALAEKGFFPKEELLKLRKTGAMLQGHPDMKATPGLDMTTGSLGQGLSAANGMALAAKLDNKDYRVYVIMGDGEIQEGQIWEAAMTAAHYKLDNLTAFVDHNGLQIDGPITKVMSPESIQEKFKAFGWNVIDIDGHDIQQILEAVEEAKTVKGKPTVIVSKTVKGKGVPFMENQVGWHGKAPTLDQAKEALEIL